MLKKLAIALGLVAVMTCARAEQPWYPRPIVGADGALIGYDVSLRCKNVVLKFRVIDVDTWANVFGLLHGAITPEEFMREYDRGRVHLSPKGTAVIADYCYNIADEQLAALRFEVFSNNN